MPDELTPSSRTDQSDELLVERRGPALWLRIIPGCREGLAALAATGVRLGIISLDMFAVLFGGAEGQDQ